MLFQDALGCVIGDEINNIAVEGVETLGHKLVTLAKQFKQSVLDGDTDVWSLVNLQWYSY